MLYTAVKDQPEAKAMLLVALNFCFYPIDLARLQWSEIDMDRGTFSAKRGKTKVARVAVIWPETLEVLKQLKRSEADDCAFHTVTGRPHNDNTTRKWFYDLRDGLKDMPKTVQMADLRDGAYTEAVQGEGVEFVHAQILAGHRAPGMSDMYVRRNPKMVAKACDAVRRAYLA
jgi:integrase